MTERICAIEGCDRPRKQRHRWCGPHYHRWLMDGDPLAPRRRAESPDLVRRAAYARWKAMIHRCTNPADRGWKNYGGRGITICPEWLDSFEAYYAHVGDPPFEGATVDRENNDLGYFPGNVRWATRFEQTHNRRPGWAAKTHCPRDHEYTEANTYVYRGCRSCRACRRENARNLRAIEANGRAS